MDDFAKLAADLSGTGDRIGRQAAQVVRKTARDIEGTAKRLAPVDTGALRASIGTTIEGDGRFSRMEAEIGPTVHYAPYLEFGTARSAPQPFLGPAFNQHADGYVQAMRQLGGQIL